MSVTNPFLEVYCQEYSINGFYIYLNEQEQLYYSHGWLIIPLYPYPVIIINPRP